MKKFIVTLLIVILSATSAYARPTRYNPHQGHGYHQNNNRPVVIREKSHRSDVVATGIISGIAGFVIGSNLSNSNNYYYNNSDYGSTTIVDRRDADCTTIYNRRQGTKTTTCRSRPQYDNVVIIQ